MSTFQDISLVNFTTRPYRMKRLEPFLEMMSQDHLGIGFDPVVKKVLDLQGFNVEESPRSIYRVEKLYEALNKFAPGRVPDPAIDKHVRNGIALARACFSRPSNEPRLRPLNLDSESVRLIVSNPAASAGLTAWGETKAQCETRALNRAHETLAGKKSPEPCIAFKRTQFNDKTRLVWGYPYSMTLIEGCFARPLIDRFKGRKPLAFGMSSLALGTNLRVSGYHGRYAYSVDMSSFDASISAKLINIAFDILSTWFDFTSPWDLDDGYSRKKEWQLIVNYFITTPIVMPNGRLYLGKKHGVPSGSYFTQLIDSIVNVIIAGTIASRFQMFISKEHLYVLGDDLLMFSNVMVELSDLAAYAESVFKVKFNAQKSACYPSDSIHYLGRDWINGIPTLDLQGIVQRMLYTERFRVYSKDDSMKVRQAKILIMSFCWQYARAYPLMRQSLAPRLTIPPKAVEIDLFCREGHKVNPNHLSGLMRYKLLYESTVPNLPAVATTFWL